MSKVVSLISDDELEHNSVRERIKFSLQFATMMLLAGRNEEAGKHLIKIQELADLIPLNIQAND